MTYRILAINPGSTSTKIACYENENCLFTETIRHDSDEIAKIGNIIGQYPMRKATILELLESRSIPLTSFDVVVGRGGMLTPIDAGAYEVNELMLEVLRDTPNQHASNLGAMLAFDIGRDIGVPALIYDAVSVDEQQDIARYTGFPDVKRTAFIHALNMRSAAFSTARELGKNYADCNLIVAHLGGGITMSVHSGGRMIDTIHDDEGPMAPERAGRIPGIDLVLHYDKVAEPVRDFIYRIRGRGGLMAHLGTSDAFEIERMVDGGDAHARELCLAMAYQCAKAIGELATVTCGKVDRIVLTGGLVRFALVTDEIVRRVSFIAPVHLIAGENELESLALGALRVLREEESAKTFTIRHV